MGFGIGRGRWCPSRAGVLGAVGVECFGCGMGLDVIAVGHVGRCRTAGNQQGDKQGDESEFVHGMCFIMVQGGRLKTDFGFQTTFLPLVFARRPIDVFFFDNAAFENLGG